MLTWLIILIVVVVVAYVAVVFNRLVRTRQMADEAWSGIDVQLKRRSDLVPNLVEAVKGYAAHERNVLDEVTRLRGAAQAVPINDVAARAQAESALSAGLGRLIALSENYPDLKASANFLALQQQLSALEDDLQMARRYYNGAARNMNVMVQSFPSNLIAGMFGFSARAFFELADDMEVGAGTFHPATTLRALGPKPWNAAYVQPSRRPKDGRYGENPNRLQHYYQFQVILKPSPADIQDLYLNSLKAIGIDPRVHDIRFVEDDWESPTLGAWGLGWECWCDGMEVSQFTYFQQVAGFECNPVAGELTYGLERLAMYVQGVERVYDLNFNGLEGDRKVTYGDVFLQAEQEYSRHNFEFADTAMLFEQFKMAEGACKKYLADGWNAEHTRHAMALPAYDQCIKASHVFNLLDARGVISVTERQSYILRVRELAKACGEAWLATDGGGAG